MPGPKFETNDGNFVDHVKKSYEISVFAFPIFPVSSNIFSSLMESQYNVFAGNHFYDKINQIKVSERFLSPRNTTNFGAKTNVFPHNLFTNCIHVSKLLNIYAREPHSRQEESCFLNNEMPKKFMLAQI